MAVIAEGQIYRPGKIVGELLGLFVYIGIYFPALGTPSKAPGNRGSDTETRAPFDPATAWLGWVERRLAQEAEKLIEIAGVESAVFWFGGVVEVGVDSGPRLAEQVIQPARRCDGVG